MDTMKVYVHVGDLKYNGLVTSSFYDSKSLSIQSQMHAKKQCG